MSDPRVVAFVMYIAGSVLFMVGSIISLVSVLHK